MWAWRGEAVTCRWAPQPGTECAVRQHTQSLTLLRLRLYGGREPSGLGSDRASLSGERTSAGEGAPAGWPGRGTSYRPRAVPPRLNSTR